MTVTTVVQGSNAELIRDFRKRWLQEARLTCYKPFLPILNFLPGWNHPRVISGEHTVRYPYSTHMGGLPKSKTIMSAATPVPGAILILSVTHRYLEKYGSTAWQGFLSLGIG